MAGKIELIVIVQRGLGKIEEDIKSESWGRKELTVSRKMRNVLGERGEMKEKHAKS